MEARGQPEAVGGESWKTAALCRDGVQIHSCVSLGTDRSTCRVTFLSWAGTKL